MSGAAGRVPAAGALVRGPDAVCHDRDLHRGERVVPGANREGLRVRKVVQDKQRIRSPGGGLEIAHQHVGLGGGGECEGAGEREQGRYGERAGGAGEAAPREARARGTRRPAGGGCTCIRRR